MKSNLPELQLSIKSLSDDGSFEGILSPYGNVDQGGDVVEAGAFSKSIAEYGNVIPCLWQHKQDVPIGSLTLSDREDGLYCSGKFCLDTDVNGNYMVPEAAKAYALLKAQVIKGLSIGYLTIKAQNINGVRHLKELRLWEGSVVSFPMNTGAQVNSVKHNETKGDFLEELSDRQVSDQQGQLFSALSSALYPLAWSGESRTDILSAAQTACDQFTAAYMSFLPQYLDYLSKEYGVDTKAWADKRELKEGRKISASTRDILTAAHEHLKSAFDVLDGLLSEDDSVDDDPNNLDLDSEEFKAHTLSLDSMLDLLR